MKHLLMICLTIIMSGACLLAAPPKKSCVAINKILNQSTADEEFFRSLMERLQDAIVNTGKFDVVDNTRLEEVAREVKKIEEGLSDDELEASQKAAMISIHGTVLSMIVESQDVSAYNLKHSRIIGTLEMTIRFQDMRNGLISSSKRVKVSKVVLSQESRRNTGEMTVKVDVQDPRQPERQAGYVGPQKSENSGNTVSQKVKVSWDAPPQGGAVITNTSKRRKFTRIVEPEKVIKDPRTGRIVTIPAKKEIIYFTPEEEKVYNEVMHEAVDQVVEKLMEHAYPLYVVGASNGRVYINLPEERSREKMAAGRRFEIVRMGEEIIDPDSGDTLGAEEERVMVVALETIRPKFAIAVPVPNGKRFSVLEDGMRKYRVQLKAAKDAAARRRIKPPFQARQLEGNTVKIPAAAPAAPPAPGIDSRFSR